MFNLGDKSATKSVTILGAAVFAAVQAAEAMGQIPAGAAVQLAGAVKAIAGLLTVFGFRRAIGENGLLGPEPEDE